MPTRSSRVKSAAASAPIDVSYFKRAVPYHGTAITILWVTFLFMTVATWIVILAYSSSINKLERALLVQQIQLANLDLKVNAYQQAMGGEKVTTPATPTSAVNAPSAAQNASPSGKLKRGSLSPDGTKYAGYEETTKGKIGIAVETLDSQRIRYIVIFNPFTESTGAGTALESSMSVRWIDNSTIEYDVLVKRSGSEVKDTEKVRIFF